MITSLKNKAEKLATKLFLNKNTSRALQRQEHISEGRVV